MNSELISRRSAIKAASGILLASSLPGCGSGAGNTAAQAGRVVVQVGFKIAKIATALVRAASLALEIVAILADGVHKTISANLTVEQLDVLKNGGELIIRSIDGREFPVAVVIQ